jgi:hypothetical protein
VVVVKDELAESLLAAVMGWGSEEVAAHVPALQALASFKYDEYEGFSAGVKFVERLASWLDQFSADERHTAISFVLKQLVFISRAEMDHAISLVYPDMIRPILIRRAAAELGIGAHRLAAIVENPAFQTLERQTLILGMADGARLDRLRRASSRLSHEQFSLVIEVGEAAIDMRDKLAEALSERGLPGEPVFRQIVLVDDFSGSGFTLIRPDGSSWKGKLPKAASQIKQMQETGIVAEDASVAVALYVVTRRALVHVAEHCAGAGLEWPVFEGQILEDGIRVSDAAMVALCRAYYDPKLDDQHKGSPVLGFRDVALPLVLSHNTPNDSLALLWGDTTDREDSLQRRALFPRYERHHPDRP